MIKSNFFWTLVSTCIVVLFVFFYWAGYRSANKVAIKKEAIVTEAEELQFVKDVQTLDTLLLQLRKAVYSKDKSTIVKINIEWKNHIVFFRKNHRQNAVLSSVGEIVIKNYEQRISNFKVNLKEKLDTADEVVNIQEAIKLGEAKRDELKTENQMLKQVILTL